MEMSNKRKSDAVGLLVSALAIPALLVYLAWAFALWQIDAAQWTMPARAWYLGAVIGFWWLMLAAISLAPKRKAP
jgi:hypothetical protein